MKKHIIGGNRNRSLKVSNNTKKLYAGYPYVDVIRRTHERCLSIGRGPRKYPEGRKDVDGLFFTMEGDVMDLAMFTRYLQNLSKSMNRPIITATQGINALSLKAISDSRFKQWADIMNPKEKRPLNNKDYYRHIFEKEGITDQSVNKACDAALESLYNHISLIQEPRKYNVRERRSMIGMGALHSYGCVIIPTA